MGKTNFLLPKDKYRSLHAMTNEEAGALFKAVYYYVDLGKIASAEQFKNDRFLFGVYDDLIHYIADSEEKYQKKVETNRRNGSKGGRKPDASKEAEKAFLENLDA